MFHSKSMDLKNTVNDYTSVHYTQADAGGAGGGGGAGAPGAP